MGFLNFIKKTKKKEDFSFPSNLDLDIPPPPPTVKSAAKVEKELPSFSAKKVELPKKPIEIPKPEIRPVPKFVEKFEKKAFKEEKEELKEDIINSTDLEKLQIKWSDMVEKAKVLNNSLSSVLKISYPLTDIHHLQ